MGTKQKHRTVAVRLSFQAPSKLKTPSREDPPFINNAIGVYVTWAIITILTIMIIPFV